jgi:hypothetical protein
MGLGCSGDRAAHATRSNAAVLAGPRNSHARSDAHIEYSASPQIACRPAILRL